MTQAMNVIELQNVSKSSGKMRICGCADLRSGKMRRNTADIPADVVDKMRMWHCGYATNERMPIACLHCAFALNILLYVLHGWVGLTFS